MANEGAWGAALQSLGGSVTDYYKQKSTEQAQAEKDRKLADAIFAKEERENLAAIEEDKRKGRMEYLKSQDFMQAGYPEQIIAGLPPSVSGQLPPRGRLDMPYSQAIFTPAQEAGPLPSSRISGELGRFIAGEPVSEDVQFRQKEKPMTAYQEQSLLLRKERESRMKKYAEYTRSQGLNGKLTDAQIASIYKTVDDKYDMDFNLLGKLRQGLITQDEIDEMRALEKLNLVRSVAETGKAARGGNIPAKPKAKEEPKPKSAGDIADGTIKTVGSKKFVRSGGAWVQQ